MENQPTVVVTGAAAGIGAAVVQQLVTDGAHVIAFDRSPVERDDVEYVQVDLSDPASIDAAVAQLPDRLDALCNIAGVSGVVGSDLTLRINFLGLRKLTTDLADRLVGGGSVVNIASFAGVGWLERKDLHLQLARTSNFEDGLQWLQDNPVTDDFAYPYSKEVLRVWSQLQATRWVERGIRVNVINPGPVKTAILGEFVEVLGEEKVGDDIGRVGRAATAADIAPVVCWLTRPESAWINGADIATDGGLTASFIEERN